MQKEILDQITAFAEKAHGDQKRKYSTEPYIVHPIRVMEICRKYTNDRATLAAALLHDVLEDTSVSEEEIRSFLDDILSPLETIQAIKLINELTDQYIPKNYPGLNRRARKKKEAARLAACSEETQTIKYADILDNTINIAEYDPDFGPVFLEEGLRFLNTMTKGNSQLREEALAVVKENFQKLKKVNSV